MPALPNLLLAALFSVELSGPCSLLAPAAERTSCALAQPEVDDHAVLFGARQAVSEVLVELAVEGQIQARVKAPDSLRAKARRKGIAEEEVLDRLALRVIVDEEAACDRVADALLDRYRVVPGSVDDYIRSPKANGYQSLHMALHAGPRQEVVEVQVRTAAMHAHAERGGAAHQLYKAWQRQLAVSPS